MVGNVATNGSRKSIRLAMADALECA